MTIIWMVIGILIIALFIILAIFKSISAHKEKIATGSDAFIGRIGTAKTDINPEGMFYVYGELWRAETRGEPLKAGEKGRVVAIEQLDEKYLIVEKIKM